MKVRRLVTGSLKQSGNARLRERQTIERMCLLSGGGYEKRYAMSRIFFVFT
jgi:hypothetical protein